MAANHLTVEDAAERLGLSPEEFRRKLKTDPAFKELDRGKIRDGSSFRFKESAVDELARELSASSNPENPLPSLGGDGSSVDSDDFKVHAAATKKTDDEPLSFGTEDVFSLASEDSGGEQPPKPKKGSDSDVRLEAGKKPAEKPAGEEGVQTEEISIDYAGPGSAVIKGGSSSKLSAPKSSGKLTSADSAKSLAKPGTGDSSEFELSLDADSDDFELKLNTESSDEVELGSMPKEKDAGSSGRRGGESGILSRKPNDSGPSLEKAKPKERPPLAPQTDSDSDVDFELTLDSSAAVSGTKLGGPKGKKPADSDSEFELTLDDSSGSGELERAALGDAVDASKGDIFETDFEIPPMEESGSEAVALESSDTDLEKSDVDIEIAADDSDVVAADPESGSEVVLLEEEEEAPATKGKGKTAAKGKKAVVAEEEEEGDVDLADVGEEDDEDASVSKALKGAKAKRRDEDEEEEEAEAVPAGAYRPVPWGIFPVVFLILAFPLVLFGGLMGYELLQTMHGYQQPRKPSAPIVRWVATNLDMELKDQ